VFTFKAKYSKGTLDDVYEQRESRYVTDLVLVDVTNVFQAEIL